MGIIPSQNFQMISLAHFQAEFGAIFCLAQSSVDGTTELPKHGQSGVEVEIVF